MTIDYRLLATSVLGGVIFTFLANAASSKVLSLLQNVGVITQWLKKVGDNIASLGASQWITFLQKPANRDGERLSDGRRNGPLTR